VKNDEKLPTTHFLLLWVERSLFSPLNTLTMREYRRFLPIFRPAEDKNRKFLKFWVAFYNYTHRLQRRMKKKQEQNQTGSALITLLSKFSFDQNEKKKNNNEGMKHPPYSLINK
jgi:hypothetical protein